MVPISTTKDTKIMKEKRPSTQPPSPFVSVVPFVFKVFPAHYGRATFLKSATPDVLPSDLVIFIPTFQAKRLELL
jgi:hypothetical protein